MSVYPASPVVWDAAKETHFFLNLSRILKCWETDQQPRLSVGIKETMLQTVSGSPPTSYQGSPACRSSRLTPNTAHVTHTHSHFVLGPALPSRAEGASFCSRLVSKQTQKLAQLCGTERKHTNLSIQHCPRESKWETVSIQPGFAGSRECIQS